MDAQTRIEAFRDLLSSVGKIWTTEIDSDFEVVYSNAPNSEINTLFFVIKDPQLDLSEEGIRPASKLKGPALFTNDIGMSWISDNIFEGEKLKRIYMLGPVFLDDYSVQKIETRIARINLSVSMKRHFMNVIKEIPVISWNRFYEYGIMQHYAITGKKISIQDFEFPESKPLVDEEKLKQQAAGFYMLENKVMKLVEEGNLNYDNEMQKMLSINQPFRSFQTNYLREAKNSVIVSCVMCARAAVDGGLSPSTAYMLRAQYMEKIEAAQTFADVNEINRMMLDDYIKRVHRIKLQSGVSPQIKEICDYIGLHPEDKINIHVLASRLGYSDYYFSNKFKKETGKSVREYVMTQKIERACELLKNSNQDVAAIGMSLGFGTQSYFGEVFRKFTGMSPGEYRSQHQRE